LRLVSITNGVSPSEPSAAEMPRPYSTVTSVAWKLETFSANPVAWSIPASFSRREISPT
jgi:hypothetical protein